MSLINRVSSGLLGLLDTKAQGRTPNEIEDTVRPTIDLDEMFATNLGYETVSVSAAIVATGSVSPVFVPNGQLWRIRAVSARALNTAAATGSLTCTVGIAPPGQGTLDTVWLSSALPVFQTQVAPGEETVGAQVFASPVLLRGGAQVVSRVLQNSAASAFVTTTVFFNRITD